MKHVIICLLLVSCLIFSNQASAVTQVKKINSVKSFEQTTEVVKIKITNQKDANAIIENLKKANDVAVFQTCFVYITDIYLSEATNGEMYVTVEYNVRCYGVPGVNDMVLVIDRTT